MNFDLDENQLQFKDTVGRFCQSVDTARRTEIRRLPGGFDRGRWLELAEMGMIGLAAAEADGGLGGSMLDCAVVAQELGQRLTVEPWLECAFLPAKLLAGTPHSGALIDGSTLATLAFAETGGRYSLDANAVTVQGGRLSGEKIFVLSGAVADLFIVTARVDGATQMFAVPRGADGLMVKPYPVADGSVAAVVTFHGVAVGAPIGGMAQLMVAIDATRLIAAAEMAGVARRVFDETLEYVKTREQFGQPIGRFQVIQHRLVDAYAKCEQIQSAIYRAMLITDTPAEAVKAHVAEEALWVAQQAVQLHGGMGMTDELCIGHGLKRILLLSRLFGDPASGIAALARTSS